MISTSAGAGGAAVRAQRRRAAGRRLDVLRDDAAVRARAGNEGEIDPALSGDPARQRACLDATVRSSAPGAGAPHDGAGAAATSGLTRAPVTAAAQRGERESALGCWVAAGPSSPPLTLPLDHGHRRADPDLALGHDDLEEDAVELGLDLLRHLVGVELVERLSLLTRSPSPLSQRTIVPDSIPCPRRGSLTSVATSAPPAGSNYLGVLDYLGHRGHYADAT